MYQMQPDVLAEITLSGERRTVAYSGYRPAHLIGDYLTTGVHTYIGKEILGMGETCKGYITFISPEYYPHSIGVGDQLSFQEGSRITGYAKILEIYNPVLERTGAGDKESGKEI